MHSSHDIRLTRPYCAAYNDGRAQLLICIHGLIPITYRQSTYNIPIAIWITRDYPREPPIVYVVPTGDMLVKPGNHVDVSGRSNIEYMQNWERKSEVRPSIASIPSPFFKSPRAAISSAGQTKGL